MFHRLYRRFDKGVFLLFTMEVYRERISLSPTPSQTKLYGTWYHKQKLINSHPTVGEICQKGAGKYASDVYLNFDLMGFLPLTESDAQVHSWQVVCLEREGRGLFPCGGDS